MTPYYERGGICLFGGDCLAVLPCLDEQVDLIATDPPYGIDYQSAWRIDRSQWKPKIANDEQPFIWWLYPAFRVLKDGGAMLCFCRWDVQEAFKLAEVGHGSGADESPWSAGASTQSAGHHLV